MSLTITIEPKFTSVNLSSTIKKYWEKSLIETEVTFNLKKVEWISLEEITFLFGWIRHVKHNNVNLKKIHVELPPLNQNEPEKFPDIQTKDEIIRRRKTRLISLWDRWKIYEKCELQIDELNVSDEINRYVDNKNLSDNNWHRIVPFFAIPVNEYHNVYDLRETIKSDVEKKFRLQEHVLQMLTENTSYSVFENKSLSNIITTELYLNVIHHSFGHNTVENKECYFAIALRNKIDIERYIIQKKKDGKTISKETAKKSIQFILEQNANNERPLDERAFFQSRNNGEKYLNESFIEFTFTDFGNGIASTLAEKYYEEINDTEKRTFLRAQLSPEHFNASLNNKQQVNIDSLILEYSFLLHSSRHPFEKQIEVNEYVPRGLYFLLDIVKRYKGMVVARSNRGKIVYDFSVSSSIQDAVRFSPIEETIFYPGTLISIYIPAEKKQGIVKLNAVQRILHHKQEKTKRELQYINVSDLQKQAINIYKFENDFKDPELNKLYNLVFQSLNEKLDEFNKTPCVLYIDFAGTDSSAIDHKIYYYLSNSPKINENTSVVILNGTDKGVLKDVQDSIIKSKDFICRPIPCVFSNNEIIWIGIKDIEDETTLNELWRYIESRQSIAVSDFQDINSLSGNVIKVDWINKIQNVGNVSLQMLSDEEIKTYKFIIPEPSKKYSCTIVPALYVKAVLAKDEKHKVLLQKENEVYWTSGGYYQKEFIRFIEKLYEINFIAENVTKYDNDFEFGRKVSEYLIRKYEYKLKKPLEFDCIVSVTLSSQLLANAVRAIYCEINNIQNEKDKPTIIRLANYYEFTNEKAFKKIKPNQKVLIVNDVISTGKLNEEIFNSLIRKPKMADVVGIFSIIDSRQSETIIEGKVIEKEVEHFSTPKINEKTIWLLQNPIEKFLSNPKPFAEIISIDPVINAPNTMRYERSDITRLVYSDNHSAAKNNFDFLQKIQDPTMLLVGHLHHNVAHHSYFFKLHEWFLSDSGQDLIKLLVSEIKHSGTDINHKAINKEKKRTVVDFVQNELSIHESYFKDSEPQIFKQYQKTLKELKKLHVESEQLELPVINYKTDVIFYPMFSGAEVLDKANYKDIFEISSHSNFILFPLGRVDTPKGWRFTFPPKVLNEISEKYKNVFILDDGTCTGDTLMQMIDSIAFLNVERITVLSIVGRLEDFQREFFTRLQAIKVIYEKDDKKVRDRIVPLNIFFGAHFHIQVYPAFTSNCPFCDEQEKLNKEKNNLAPPSEHVLKYICQRLEELEVYETDGLRYEHYFDSVSKGYKGLPSYIPSNIDRKQLFLYRDKIGKLASYRTFKEYLTGFENNDSEIWIAIIIHEPKIIKTIEQLLPSLKEGLKTFILSIIKVDTTSLNLRFNWKLSHLIRFVTIIDSSYFLKLNNLKKIIKSIFSKTKVPNLEMDIEACMNFIAYYFWKTVISEDKDKNDISLSSKAIQCIDSFWFEINLARNQFTNNQIVIVKVFDKLHHWIKEHQFFSNKPHEIFSRLKKFYVLRSTEFPNHNIFLQDFDQIYGKIDRFKNLLRQQLKSSIKELEIDNLKKINDAFFSNLDDNLTKLIYNQNFQNVIQKTSIYQEYFNNENELKYLIEHNKKLIQGLHIESLTIEYINETIDNLVLLRDIYLSGNSNFSKFFLEHEVDFEKLTNEIHEEHENILSEEKIALTISYPINASEIKLNIHPKLYRVILTQLYNNCIKHTKEFRKSSPSDNRNIISELSFTIENDKVNLHHYQNIPNLNGKGSGYNDIKIIMEFFGGTVLFSDNKEIFEVDISFVLSNNIIISKNGK